MAAVSDEIRTLAHLQQSRHQFLEARCRGRIVEVAHVAQGRIELDGKAGKVRELFRIERIFEIDIGQEVDRGTFRDRTETNDMVVARYAELGLERGKQWPR